MAQDADATIVVTRHPALVDYLRERGILQGECAVKAQVSPDDIRGCHVIGVLPLHLAALADRVTTVDLDIPIDLRGSELSLEQLRAFARAVTTYRVTVLS